jgi:hypothetical protein
MTIHAIPRICSTGGDLRYYLETHGAMAEDMARFYCAELLLGLEDLHSLKIVWRYACGRKHRVPVCCFFMYRRGF